MANGKSTRTFGGLNRYLIPILLGLSGMLFAQQLPNPMLRTAVVLLSLSAPVFAGGHLLARVEGGGYQRIVLIAGVFMLVLGAIVTVIQFPVDDPFDEATHEARMSTPETVLNFSRWLGLTSLVLGLFAVLLILARREEQMEAMSHRFRSLAEHMSEGFVLSTEDGTISAVNKALLDMAGLEEHQLLGRRTEQLLNELNLQPTIVKQSKNGATELRVTSDVSGEKKHYWITSTPILGSSGRARGLIATVRDMTEHQHMADQLEQYAESLEKLVAERTEKLRQSEQRLRDLLLQMSEGVVTVDSAYAIRFVNNRFCAILQMPSESVLGRSLMDFITSDDRARLERVVESARSSHDERSRTELEILREDGTRMPVLLTMAPFHDTRDELPRYSIVLTDVSELKVMQHQLEVHARELEEANRELRVLDKAKDSFLTNVSHELRTPLSTIRGYIDMLRSGSLGGLAESQQTAVDVMARNSDRLSTLIAEMIEFSRMQIRGIAIDRTLFALAEVAEEAIASAQPEALRRGLKIALACDAACPLVWGDRERIGQIVSILLSNALKFSHDGGRVEVTVRCDELGTARVGVRDYGIGIPRRHQPRVFDKFYQVDSSLSRRYEGAGIGLSIAKNLTEAHGGRIDLESEAGRGSTFTLVLTGAAFRKSETASEIRLDGANVLLVLDSPLMRGALSEVLKQAGARVVEAATAFEGLRRAEDGAFDLGIVGDRLRDLSGDALLKKLGSERPHLEWPWIMVAEPESNAEQTDATFDAARLTKPFRPSDLLQCATLFIEAWRARESGLAPSSMPEPAARVLLAGNGSPLMRWVNRALTIAGVETICAESTDAVAAELKRQPVDLAFVHRDVADSSIDALLATIDAAPRVPNCIRVATEAGDAGGIQRPRVEVLVLPFTLRALLSGLRHAVSENDESKQEANSGG